jgi:hypothetical protein
MWWLVIFFGGLTWLLVRIGFPGRKRETMRGVAKGARMFVCGSLATATGLLTVGGIGASLSPQTTGATSATPNAAAKPAQFLSPAVARGKRYALNVTANLGASIAVLDANGQKVASNSSQLSAALPRGTYFVKVGLNTYKPFKRRVSIPENKNLRVTLEQDLRVLSISLPVKTGIIVYDQSGVQVAKTFASRANFKLVAGHYTVALARDGYVAKTVSANAGTRVNTALQRVPPPPPPPLLAAEARDPEPSARVVDRGGVCGNYGSWSEAQAAFLAYGYSRMDRDKDGVACESLR